MMVTAMFKRSKFILIAGVFSVLSSNAHAAEVTAPTFHAELSAHAAVNGSILLVKMTNASQAGSSDIVVKYNGRHYPVFSTQGGFEAVLGVPYDKAPGPATVEVIFNKTSTVLPFEIKDGNYPSEVLKVDDRHVNPKKADLLRIRKESAEIGKIYAVMTLKKYWVGSFQLPINSVVTSTFGNKRVFNGAMKSFHQGLDLKAPMGTPIHAASGGVVVMAKDLFMTGNTVLLNHGYGIFTVYAHMSKLEVKNGQVVAAGQVLGLSGMTGRASGPHLHWGAVINHTKVNPTDLTTVVQ